MRTLLVLKCTKNDKGIFPTSHEIAEGIFIGAGWGDEEVNEISAWQDKQKYFQGKAMDLFDHQKQFLPESVRLQESLSKVIFFGTAGKSVILVTKVNQSETFVRIIRDDLIQLQGTTELVVKTIRDHFKTVKDSKVSILNDEVLMFERGYDHKIMRGDILRKGNPWQTLLTIKKQDSGNYYLLLVTLSYLVMAFIFDLVSHQYLSNLVQFADRALLAGIGVFATPFAKFIQQTLQIRSIKMIKWEPVGEVQQ